MTDAERIAELEERIQKLEAEAERVREYTTPFWDGASGKACGIHHWTCKCFACQGARR